MGKIQAEETIDDIKKLNETGVEGVVIGSALYKYKIDSSSPNNPITTEKLFSNRIKSLISKSNNGKITLEEILKKNENNNKDHFKPDGVIFYDYLRKHPYLKPNDLIRTNIYHPIKNKGYNYYDDYNQPYEKKEEKPIYNKISEKDSILHKYQLSDPFNLRDDNIFKNKSGELYLLKEKKNKKENFDLKDNDLLNEWIHKYPNRRNFVGYTSVKFNILNPGTKSLFKTKDEIELGFKPSIKTLCICFLKSSSISLLKIFKKLISNNCITFFLNNFTISKPLFSLYFYHMIFLNIILSLLNIPCILHIVLLSPSYFVPILF